MADGGASTEEGRGCRRKKAKTWDDFADSDDASLNSSPGTPKSNSSKSRAHMAVMALIELPTSAIKQDTQKKRSVGANAGIGNGTLGSKHDWATTIVRYVHKNGQDLLSQVCGRYKLTYDGVIGSIPESMHEQIAHCLLYNPSLFKTGEGLPVGIRECKGVTDFKIAFLQDHDAVVRNIKVNCCLSGEPFEVELRACSNCGSCFSGRFMDVGAHQRAGGWKEITERISAGKHSWSDLKGWRLCVPCFVNWGVKGSTDNSKRSSIPQVMSLGLKSVSMVNFDGTTDAAGGGSSSTSSAGSGKKRKSNGPGTPPARKEARTASEAPKRQEKQRKERSYTPPSPRESLHGDRKEPSMSALSWAAHVGSCQEVIGLIEAGADPMARDKSGQTCLHTAANAGHASVVRALVERKGGQELLMVRDEAGKTCLHRAADAGHLEVTKVLCDLGGEKLVQAQAKISQTALHNAASSGHLEVVRLLMERGGRGLLLKRDEIGATCLHWAVEGGQAETVQLLAEEGGLDLMLLRDVVGKTCLHRAVDEDFREAVEILADLGQKELLLVKDEDNLTCIGWAVELDHSEIAQVLVEKGLRFFLVGSGEESSKKSKEKEHQRREEELSRREREVARREKLLKDFEALRALAPAAAAATAATAAAAGGQACKECTLRNSVAGGGQKGPPSPAKVDQSC